MIYGQEIACATLGEMRRRGWSRPGRVLTAGKQRAQREARVHRVSVTDLSFKSSEKGTHLGDD